jgi:hypothetical protein
LHFTVFDDRDRLKRALSRLGLFWLAAVGSVFIIILHWVLVPGFVIAGPIMAVSAYRTKRIATQASGVCPVCNENINIELEPKDVPPMWRPCPACKKTIHIDH